MSGIVIIGAGHAAGQAAASLRQAKYAEAITIVGDEAYPPYQRPPLSKQYLSGEQGVDRVYLRAEKFYADNDIQLILNTRARNSSIRQATKCALATGKHSTTKNCCSVPVRVRAN